MKKIIEIIIGVINFYKLEKKSLNFLTKIYITVFTFSGLYFIFTSSEVAKNISMYSFFILITNSILFSVFVAVFDNKNLEI